MNTDTGLGSVHRLFVSLHLEKKKHICIYIYTHIDIDIDRGMVETWGFQFDDKHVGKGLLGDFVGDILLRTSDTWVPKETAAGVLGKSLTW